jgi:ribosomal protein L29
MKRIINLKRLRKPRKNKMAILKNKDMAKMSHKDIDEKIKELKMELVKEKVSSTKGGKLKTREIKRTIARLLTFDRINENSVKK